MLRETYLVVNSQNILSNKSASLKTPESKKSAAAEFAAADPLRMCIIMPLFGR